MITWALRYLERRRQEGQGAGPETGKPTLVAEPVKLTPAWEEKNLPNDELNFKSVTMDQADLEINPPNDRCKLVYLVLVLHGIGTLMPWNMFITAKNYFIEYKLSANNTDVKSDYADNFMPYIGIASQVPNFFFNWLNIFVVIGGNLTTRIVWSILTEVLAFFLTVVLAMLDSSTWPGFFFWITIGSVVVLNMANGIYQNTVYGMAAKLPLKYTSAVILGSNISGTFTSIISIVSTAMAPNDRTAAIYYFITALFVLLMCFDTYFALPLNRFYRYHELLNQKAIQAKAAEGNSRPPYWKIFKQCSPQLFNVFFIFFITLAIFPAVHSDIKESTFNIGPTYYVSVMCFLTFNATAMLGSLFSSWFVWPGPKGLIIPVLLRGLLLPAFLLCNYQPRGVHRTLGVLFMNDWIVLALGVILGLSGGYYSSLAMMYCPRMVEPRYSSTAGMFGAACLVSGICAGIVFALVCPWLVSNLTLPIV
ncbi:equilibrative nucleoside transporter 3 isoform X2 [Bemisia tabaci]|uniref:equilibrative nucleoside transporter 3 isoform X2 n=1 Tax=Bemisia tabaci TaxID=7038 RepID=UPI0008F9B986|nr:PREDICTED: equilibrative nucleoside transporter 3 isoform X2 [Bemisia tabaci]